MDNNTMTPKEAAKEAGVCTATIYNAIRDKALKTVRKPFKHSAGKRFLISRQALADYMLSRLNKEAQNDDAGRA